MEAVERKQKILIVHNYYQISGGEDTVVSNEKRLLEENGHEVFLYTRHNAELKKFNSCQKLGLPFTTVFNPRTYFEVRKLIKDEKISIVHVHNTLNLISPSVYYAALSLNVPVVQTIHNFRLLCPAATFYRRGHVCEECMTHGLGCAVRYGCYRNSKVQTFLCAVTTKIHRLTGVYGKINYICLTDFNKEKLLEIKQIKPERVFVKPNFMFRENKSYPSFDGVRKYVYAGRLDESKGIQILLEAWKLLGESAPQLEIYGTGPLEDWCRNFIIENKLYSVKMMGFVENHMILEIFRKSKALILPTQWYEGFPMSIVEAFSAGIPVIGSGLGNVGAIIKNNENGWKFHHDSPQELAECVLKCERAEPVNIQPDEELYPEKNYRILLNIYSQVQ